MTLNKLALVLGFGMSVVAGAASAAAQGHGTVKFTGSIIDAPCSITPDVITDAGGKQIKLGTPSAAQALRDGNNDLNFAAYLQGSAAEAAVPGDFTAIATFALTYQ